MKRINMLSKIASVIINYNEADCIINRDKAMEMAETVLQMQEKLGMLPPFVDQYESDTSLDLIGNRWEEE
jgi:hypothetical protein